MLRAYDCDSHVWEGEHVFVDRYWDQRVRDRRPMVVETDSHANLSFMIDSHSFPRLTGPGIGIGGNPVSKDGLASAQFMRSRASAATTGHKDTIGSCELRTAADRIEQLDRENVAVQVNFPSLFLTWPIAPDPKVENALVRAYNSWIAEISAQASDRLKWVTVINPMDPEESVREIHRTKKLGSVGLMLLGSYGNIHLDDPSFAPIWETVADLHMPVAVHVGYSGSGLHSMYPSPFDAVTIPFSFSLMMGFHAIMRSGLLDRYPDLRVGFMENGARWVDFLVKRIAENSGKLQRTTTTTTGPSASISEAEIGGTALYPRLGATYLSKLLPEEYILRGQVFVNCEVDESQLPFVIDEYGDDFLIFAADIPHGHRVVDPITKLLSRSDIRDESKHKILIDNTARFYGLSV